MGVVRSWLRTLCLSTSTKGFRFGLPLAWMAPCQLFITLWHTGANAAKIWQRVQTFICAYPNLRDNCTFCTKTRPKRSKTDDTISTRLNREFFIGRQFFLGLYVSRVLRHRSHDSVKFERTIHSSGGDKTRVLAESHPGGQSTVFGEGFQFLPLLAEVDTQVRPRHSKVSARLVESQRLNLLKKLIELHLFLCCMRGIFWYGNNLSPWHIWE